MRRLFLLAAVALTVVASATYSLLDHEREPLNKQASVPPDTPAGLLRPGGHAAASPGSPFGRDTEGHDFDRHVALGTPAAAFDAYQLVAECRRARALESTWGHFEEKHLRELFESESKRLAHACDGITPEYEKKRLELLESAARAGVRGAAVAYAHEGYQGDIVATMAQLKDPAVQAWVQKAVNYLKSSGASGDIGAISALAMLYSNDQSLTGRDPIEELKYTTALIAIHQARGKDVRGADKALLARIALQLSPQQAQDAREAGLRLARECCKT
jgi:hypothetical protein